MINLVFGSDDPHDLSMIRSKKAAGLRPDSTTFRLLHHTSGFAGMTGQLPVDQGSEGRRGFFARLSLGSTSSPLSDSTFPGVVLGRQA